MGISSARYHSITADEKKMVTDSWMEIRPQMRDFSISLFLMVINDYPHMANYWAFKGTNDDSFEKFTSQFIREFDLLVMNLSRPSKLHPILRKNAVFHMYKNIPPVEYDRFRKCIISTLGDLVGDQNDRGQVLAAWMKCISIAFGFITEMMADMLSESTKS